MLIHPAGLAGSVVTGPVLKSFHAEGVAFFNSMRTPAALLAAAAIKVCRHSPTRVLRWGPPLSL